MINGNKLFSHRKIEELFAIVKNDLPKLDSEGLIDEGKMIKTVLHCNDRLGIQIREIRECAIPVNSNKAPLPKDFERLYYVCALRASHVHTSIGRNPFDNHFDSDVIHEAQLDRESLGCVDDYHVTIKRMNEITTHYHSDWIELGLSPGSEKYCHGSCPNKHKHGKYSIILTDDDIITPFISGELYMMYLGMMKDDEGNITFPFHPLITPFYEWSIKEKILEDALFNSDAVNIGELYKLASQKRASAYLDAFQITTERSYNEVMEQQRRKELKWHSEWFRYFQQ